jgi:NAD(P)-dependent dehydrogenase (short-subunit alcohol dehydrogenase family)
MLQEILKNKVIIITGGAGLLGRSFVRCVAQQGGVAVIADVNKKAGNKFFQDLQKESLNEEGMFVDVDITSKKSIVSMIETLHTRYGRIDALVNNAYPKNKNYGKKFEDVAYEDFCQNMSMHLGGYFLASQQLFQYFKKQGYGSIINMASIYGVVAPRFSIYENSTMTMPVEYAAIKSAIIHMTKYMAQYFKGSNIHVNCISPGGVLDRQPEEFLARYNRFAATKGMLDPKDLQGTLLFLLSDMSEFINGQNIVVDDGWAL